MSPTPLQCLMGDCGWKGRASAPTQEQITELRGHWAAEHPRRKPMASKAEITQLTELLDSYVRKALNWPVDNPGPWDYRTHELEDQVKKTAATAAGRGVAEALLICGQEGSPDKNGENAKTASGLIRASMGRVKLEQVASSEAGLNESEPTKATAPKVEQPEPEPELTTEQVQSIRATLDAGFDVETVAAQFRVQVGVVKAIRG